MKLHSLDTGAVSTARCVLALSQHQDLMLMVGLLVALYHCHRDPFAKADL